MIFHIINVHIYLILNFFVIRKLFYFFIKIELNVISNISLYKQIVFFFIFLFITKHFN